MSTSQSMIETITNIINTTNSIVSSMNDKDRIQIKDLTARVAKSTELEPKQVLDFVGFYARNTDLGYVARGKNGGFIRGKKDGKPATVSSAPSTTNTSVNDSDIDLDDEDDDIDE